MGVAGLKWGPCPPILYSFFRELNKEALLKVTPQKSSFVSKLPIFQKHEFFKNGPKNLPKSEKFKIFFAFMVPIFIGLSNGILHVLVL